MKIIMLSTDARVFDGSSASGARIGSYGSFADITLIVFRKGGREEKQLAPNVRAVAAGGKNVFSVFLKGGRELSAALKNPTDIISSQDPFFLGFLALFFGKKHGIPVQAQLHTDCFSWGYVAESPRRAVEALLAFFVLKSVSCVRVVSKRLEGKVRKLTKAPIAVLPIRILPPHSAAAPRPPEFRNNLTVLSVARLTQEKQLHLLIDALTGTEGIDAVIVGDGPQKTSLEARVRKAGLADRIRFTGWQDPHPYYANADVFIQTSRYEGYGMALLEAASHALPIITTNVGLVGDVLTDQEVVVIPGSADSLRNAVLSLKASSELRERLGQAARKKAEGRYVSESEYLLWHQKAFQMCCYQKCVLAYPQ